MNCLGLPDVRAKESGDVIDSVQLKINCLLCQLHCTTKNFCIFSKAWQTYDYFTCLLYPLLIKLILHISRSLRWCSYFVWITVHNIDIWSSIPKLIVNPAMVSDKMKEELDEQFIQWRKETKTSQRNNTSVFIGLKNMFILPMEAC